MPHISLSRDNSLLESTFYKPAYSLPKPDRAVTVLRSILGFTLVEMMVVVAVISILIAAGVVGYNHYKEQYAFSGAVRNLTHAITVARLRAIQTQTTSRLLFRPRLANPIQNWGNGLQYNVGDVVQHSPWTYRCTVAHVSNAATEPAAGDGWAANWEIVFDYQYNDLLVDVQCCPGDPAACAWVETNPYNVADPVSIRFNWSGVPVDYVDHNIRLQGAQDLALARPQTVGDITLTVTSLGRIKHQGEQK